MKVAISINNVKIEYSPDIRTTYLPIVNSIPNTGYYEWNVPHHISSNCLVRISNSDGLKPEQNILLYEFKFKINSLTSSPTYRKDFSFWLGDSNTPSPSIPEISIFQESNGKEYICFEENIKDIGDSREFHNRWHRLKVLMDQINYKIFINLDGQTIFENISFLQGHQFTPAVSISTDPCDTTDVELDDLKIHIFNNTDGENSFITLFAEDFERFEDGRFPENSGWQGRLKIQLEKDKSNSIIDNILVQRDSINGNKSLKINNSERNPFIVVKHFNIPENYPFDVSDRPFEIRYNEDMEAQNNQESLISRHEAKSLDINLTHSTSTLTSPLAFENKNTHGPNTGSSFVNTSSTAVFGTIQSTSPVDTYYIYSFDGKLMAEYDHDGNCIRDYIYVGNRLIAEYKPNYHIPEKDEEYFYYMTDQINSTRIVTADYGNVVYSEAYGPFGGVQKNWAKTYNPKFKFSGKEREAYGDLDYFGARYYDHNSYRFISTDPIINKEEALANPQLWNLYSYCRNNPITFIDPDGRAVVLGGFLAVKGLEWLGVTIAAVVGAKAIHDTWPTSYKYPDNIVPVEEVIGPWDPTKDPISLTPTLDLMDRVLQTSAKNQDEYDKHIRKYDIAKKQLKNLNNKLKNTKGPKKQKPIKEAIRKLKDDIKGHLKEIKQKWPTGRPG